MEFLEKKKILKDYIQLKLEAEDYHAVCDACMDMRELIATVPKRLVVPKEFDNSIGCVDPVEIESIEGMNLNYGADRR